MRRNERYSIQSKKNRVTRKKLYIYMIKSLSEVFSVATQYLVPVSKMPRQQKLVSRVRRNRMEERQTDKG